MLDVVEAGLEEIEPLVVEVYVLELLEVDDRFDQQLQRHLNLKY